MTAYLLRRLVLAIPVLFGVSLIVFAVLRLAPGDPALALAGMNANDEILSAIRREYGLDRPIYEQYVAYLSHILTLDFRRSVSTNLPVVEQLAGRYPITLGLTGLPNAMASPARVALGVPAGRFQ